MKHFRLAPVGRLPLEPVYYTEQARLIERLTQHRRFASPLTFGDYEITHSTPLVLVAADPTDRSHIFGWIAGEDGPIPGELTIHYGFVKEWCRKRRIFERLVAELRRSAASDVMYYTHLPPLAPRWLPDKLASMGAVYNPYLLMR